MIWQVHVYGEPKKLASPNGAKTIRVLLSCMLPLGPRLRMARRGLKQDAVYLMRPDSYVALADAKALPQNLENYFASRRLTP